MQSGEAVSTYSFVRGATAESVRYSPRMSIACSTRKRSYVVSLTFSAGSAKWMATA